MTFKKGNLKGVQKLLGLMVVSSLVLLCGITFATAGMPGNKGIGTVHASAPTGSVTWEFTAATPNASGINDTHFNGTYAWDRDSLTLTLENFVYSSSAARTLMLPDGATLTCKGVNTLINTNMYIGPEIADSVVIFVAAGRALTINGSGTLSAYCIGSVDWYSAAIEGRQDSVITITGDVTVNAKGGTTMFGVDTFVGHRSSGILYADLIISGNAKVTATGGTSVSWSYGIQYSGSGSSVTICDSASLIATGGTLVVDSSNYSVGVYSPNATLTVNDSASLIAKGGTGHQSAGIIFGGGILTINDSASVIADGGAGRENIGIINDGTAAIAINGGSLEAFGDDRAFIRPYTVPNDFKYSFSGNIDGSNPATGTSNGSFSIGNSSQYKWAKIWKHVETTGGGGDGGDGDGGDGGDGDGSGGGSDGDGTEPGGNGGLSTGAVVGIAVGSSAAAAGVTFGICWFLLRKRKVV
ncbi:MAG: hypothetical protein FWE53_01660 [Firmicutes bacterium]|nr:hypothetical protein [Bacillota bacterium]